MPDPFEVVFTRSARRALERDLPEKVATAAFEFIMGPLRQNPRRVGKPALHNRGCSWGLNPPVSSSDLAM